MSRSFKAVIDVCLSACSHVLLVGETRNQLASPSQIYFHFLVQGRGVGKIPTAVQEMIPFGVVDHFFFKRSLFRHVDSGVHSDGFERRRLTSFGLQNRQTLAAVDVGMVL